MDLVRSTPAPGGGRYSGCPDIRCADDAHDAVGLFRLDSAQQITQSRVDSVESLPRFHVMFFFH